MDTEYLEEALQVLKELRRNGPRNNWLGICANTGLGQVVVEFAGSWEKFSGNLEYPVPAVQFGHPAAEYNRVKNLWDKSTEYGRLRWELLDHLIACVEEELQNVPSSQV